MLDRTQGDSTPLYQPVEQMLGFKDWASTIDTRLSKLQQFVFPRLSAELSRQNDPESKRFLQTAMEELSGICGTIFTGEGRFPSEIPIYCLLEEEPKHEPKYNLNGTRGTHKNTTLEAAQAVVDAICPELGVRIAEDRDTLIKRVDQARTLGYARYWPSGGAYYAAMSGNICTEFSTVLPGVNMSLTCNGQGEKYISLAWQVM